MTADGETPQRHETTVRSSRGQRRTMFYAVCSCGNLRSPSRSTTGRAEQDARDHERTAQRQTVPMRDPALGIEVGYEVQKALMTRDDWAEMIDRFLGDDDG